jgi:lysophospholipase L1-like esterase
MNPKLYIALGDSISIDIYPDTDGETRFSGKSYSNLGAASLFYRNNDDAWPDFVNQDLVRLFDDELIDFHMLAEDGATSRDVLSYQIPNIPADQGDSTLVTITAGGNDLLQNLYFEQAALATTVDRIGQNILKVIETLQGHFTECDIILNTVYDPTDGSGQLDGGLDVSGLLNWLYECNSTIETIAGETGCLLADLYQHFEGHGLSEPDASERWFWDQSIIEPNALGASETRRIWLETLGF